MSYDVCEELIVEIFTRLPTKSLLRFRSVSKSIYSIIGSPIFKRLYTLRSPKKLMIRHQHCRTEKVNSKSFYTLHSEDQLPVCPTHGYTGIQEYEGPFDQFGIVGSCNGILCLLKYGDGINLWNPSIGRKVTTKDHPSLSLGNDGFIGFGYDTIIDDYKILKITTQSVTGRGYVFSSFVFTLKTSTWCEIDSPTTPLPFSCANQCLLNGVLHWVANWGSIYTNEGYYYIMTFNVSTHIFSTIALPAPSLKTEHITIIKGSLAVVSSENDMTWIWVMREYNNMSSWYVALKYDQNQFNKARLVLQLSVHGDLLFRHFIKGMFVYNLDTEVRSNIVPYNGDSCIVGMEMYVESLELLDMGSSCHGEVSDIMY